MNELLEEVEQIKTYYEGVNGEGKEFCDGAVYVLNQVIESIKRRIN